MPGLTFLYLQVTTPFSTSRWVPAGAISVWIPMSLEPRVFQELADHGRNSADPHLDAVPVAEELHDVLGHLGFDIRCGGGRDGRNRVRFSTKAVKRDT